MNAIKKIMVAVDFSDYSLAAATYGADLAEALHASLLLANVINERDVNMMKAIAVEVPAFSFDKHLEEMRMDREDRFQQLITEASCRRVPVETTIRIGVPFQELLKVIEAKKPDLLVMAAKGRSNLMDTIVGSCARRLFKRSPIPVLSIR
jgi:nucleotide-binding universal stress UspA family protein